VDFSKKQKGGFLNAKFFLKIAGVLFLAAAVFFVYSNFKLNQKKKELLGQIDSYKNQIEAIQKRNAELKEGVAKSDDPNYIEKVAREELDMQKEGEKVVAFILPEKKRVEEKPQQNFWSQNILSGWLSQSWSWIKSKF